jgi:hypothetical protein
MVRIIRLFVLFLIAVLLPSLLSAKGKPAGSAETQSCVITGDIVSNINDVGEANIVVVGLNSTDQEVVDEAGVPVCLYLTSYLITGIFPGDLPSYNAGEQCASLTGFTGFRGQLRIDKNGPAYETGGTFDFHFGPEPCTTPSYAETENGGSSTFLPFWIDGDDFCPYRLKITQGVYNRRNDRLTFDRSATFRLADHTRDNGLPHCVDVEEPDPGVNCNPNAYYVVREEPVDSIVVQFLSGSGGGHQKGGK